MALRYRDDEINTFLSLWSHEWGREYQGDVWAITRRDWDNLIDINAWALSPKDKTEATVAWMGPNYTEDIRSMARIEAQLTRLNKNEGYITVLLDVLDANGKDMNSKLMSVATASPRHRAEAAYRLLKRLY